MPQRPPRNGHGHGGSARRRLGPAVLFGALLGLLFTTVVFVGLSFIAGGGDRGPLGVPAATGATVARTPGAALGPTAAPTPEHVRAPERTITVNWVGDTVLGSQYGQPPDAARGVFADVAGVVRDADLTIGNYEGTFGVGGTPKCGPAPDGGGTCFAFQAPPQNAAALRVAGFDLMNLANNHAMDYGPTGRKQTITALDRVHIRHAGLPGSVTIVPVRGVRVAVVGFAPYRWATSLTDIPAARTLVTRAAKDADLVIVLMHAGAEGSDRTQTPPAGTTETAFGEDRGSARAFAHAVIDGGADLVLGSGPHVLRGLERHNDRLIAYSLGNFAGHTNFGMGGVLSQSGILHVKLGATGRARSGKLTSVRLVGPGTPTRDRTHAAAALVDRLSREDFGHDRVPLDAAGRFGQARRDARGGPSG